MRRSEVANATGFDAGLTSYEDGIEPLPGIRSSSPRGSFLEQLVESDRRNRYIRRLLLVKLGTSSLDPTSAAFDPLKAAVLQSRAGRLDEAFWMVFLFVHFGRHRVGRWRYAADVYGHLGGAPPWDWETVSGDVAGFRGWMDSQAEAIRSAGPGGFGNHRKYESLKDTGAVVSSYVGWVGPSRSHQDRFASAVRGAADPQVAFGDLFQSMAAVHRFGRTARFDYLATVSKLGLAPVTPDRAHLEGATGPLEGARQLFGAPSSVRPRELDLKLVELERFLGIGMDALEDALCNWQKSPTVFRPFRA
jgi:hypothetical protein